MDSEKAELLASTNGMKTPRTKSIVIALGFLLCVIAPIAKADYIYEANQDLYDLQTNSSGSTGLGSNDDSVSGAFDLGFTFTFYGNDYTQARMATNGCLHFNLTGSYCGDYTPDPLPQYTNTLFPFWTDLIKDGGSAMRAKAFDDYTIFGWYKNREAPHRFTLTISLMNVIQELLMCLELVLTTTGTPVVMQ